ncbi:MAG: hypothetical protein ACREBG_28650 [Pyrinomonadaceae bacterium]
MSELRFLHEKKAGARCRVPGVGCQVPGVRFRVTGIRFRVTGNRAQVLRVGYRLSRVSSYGSPVEIELYFRIDTRYRHLTAGTRHLTPDTWHPTPDT